MFQPRIRSSNRALEPSLNNLAAVLNSLTLCSKHAPLLTFVRHASHAAQGRANGPKDSAGRRLGAKKTASEYVIPGNIIFKQRGTKWFPGENVGIGKDHTIYSKVAGYVRYYRNPAIHPKRRYIGVALTKEGPGSSLPTPNNAPTRRRLGMYASPIITDHQAFLESHMSENSKGVTASTPAPAPLPSPAAPARFWDSNYEIGKAAEKKGIQVKDFDRSDRWLAWRKRTKRVQQGLLARAAKANRKTKGKKTNKGAGGVKKP